MQSSHSIVSHLSPLLVSSPSIKSQMKTFLRKHRKESKGRRIVTLPNLILKRTKQNHDRRGQILTVCSPGCCLCQQAKSQEPAGAVPRRLQSELLKPRDVRFVTGVRQGRSCDGKRRAVLREEPGRWGGGGEEGEEEEEDCELAASTAVGASAAVRQTSHSRPAKPCVATCVRLCGVAGLAPWIWPGRDVDVEGVEQYH